MTGPKQVEPVVQYALRGSAAWITLNRPQVRNALSSHVIDGIDTCLSLAGADKDVRSVVIASNGPVFCAGADLKMVRDNLEQDGSLTDFVTSVARLCERITQYPKPVVAAVQGAAIAGGLELVLACDLVVATENATFSDGHTRYGLFPAAGGAARLPRKIGANRAKYLLFTADTWSAERMKECGLVNDVVHTGGLHAAVDELTEVIGRRSAKGLTGLKRVVEGGLDRQLSEALALEMAEFEKYSSGADLAEGVRAFGERREPEFTRE